MWAEPAAPIRIGPTVTPLPPVIFSTLNRMLAASRFGQISRLASPFSEVSGRALCRTVSDSAASPCISPSHSMSGAILANRSRATRILRAEARSEEPKLECDRKATLGGRPKRRTSSAAMTAISASVSALGSSCTLVSAMKRVYFSSVSALRVAKPGAPRFRPSTLCRMRRWLSKRPTRPHSIASASPSWTISEPMVVLERRTIAFEASGVMPRRPMIRW